MFRAERWKGLGSFHFTRRVSFWLENDPCNGGCRRHPFFTPRSKQKRKILPNLVPFRNLFEKKKEKEKKLLPTRIVSIEIDSTMLRSKTKEKINNEDDTSSSFVFFFPDSESRRDILIFPGRAWLERGRMENSGRGLGGRRKGEELPFAIQL